jgi:mannosyltransferase
MKRVLLIAAGLSALLCAAWFSPARIEHALGWPPGALSFGPALFRLLLVFHGLVAIAAGLRTLRPSAAITRLDSPIPRLAVIVLGLFSLAALALRLWRIDNSLWVDEVLTVVYVVRLPLGQLISTFASQNQHLLYSLAAHASVAMFGESSFALRLPAVIAGVASIPALYLLGRRVAGEFTAIAASALLAFSYHHVWFSQNARGYTTLLLFSILSTWFWLGMQRRGPFRDKIGFIAATVLGLSVHLTMIFVLAAQGLVEVFTLLHARKPAPVWRAALWPYVLACTLAVQVYALAIPEFLRSGLHEVSLQSEWTSPIWLLRATVTSFGAGLVGWIIVIAGACVALVGVISLARRSRATAAVFVLPILLGGAVLIASGHNLWPRFFFFGMGFGLLIAMEGLILTAGYAARLVGQARFAPQAGATAACVLIVASAATVPRCYAYPKQDFTGARDFVERSRAADEPVAVVGLAGVVYTQYYAPHWTGIENAAELESLDAATPSPWLVYTLPIEVRTYQPDVWRVVERDYRAVKIFPGTLQGGGEVYVCRRIQGESDVSTRRQQ